ncbi:hypothetical protein HK102_001161 [Quaeritorhiza haematococci]|nr:hypothetical protein HK102_001161 [Quaeritorhiza haematococci]
MAADPTRSALLKNERQVLFVFSSCEILPSKGATGSSGAHEEGGGRPTGWNIYEVARLYRGLLKHGYLIDFASPKGGEPPMDHTTDPEATAISDVISREFLLNRPARTLLRNSKTIEQCNAGDYLAVVLIGGRVYESGQFVAGISQGVVGLCRVKLSSGHFLLQDRQATGLSNEEEMDSGEVEIDETMLTENQIKYDQAKYTKAEKKWQSHVVVDQIEGRIVTGQNPQSASDLAETLAAGIARKLRQEHKPVAEE